MIEWLRKRKRRSISEGFLHASRRQMAVIVIIATALGIASYALTVGSSYRLMQRRAAQANVFEQFFALRADLKRSTGPQGGWSVGSAVASVEERRLLLYEVLRMMQPALAEMSLDDALKSDWGAGIELLMKVLASDESGSVRFEAVPSLESLVAIAQSIGNPMNAVGDIRSDTASLLGAAVSGFWWAWEDYRAESGRPPGTGTQRPLPGLARRHESLVRCIAYSIWPPTNVGRVPRDEEVVSALLSQAGAMNAFSATKAQTVPARAGSGSTGSSTSSAGAGSSGSSLTRENGQFLTRVMLEIVSRIQADEGVKKANFWMSVGRGWVQVGMWIVFWCSVLTLAFREFAVLRAGKDAAFVEKSVPFRNFAMRGNPGTPRKDRIWAYGCDIKKAYERLKRGVARSMVEVALHKLGEADLNPAVDPDTHALAEQRDILIAAESASRWWIGWLAKALPALGFLGTVIGIALALASADSIVRASTPGAQAAAINGVSAMLGMAFTTTMIALVFGLVLTLWNDWQMARERAMIRKVFHALWSAMQDIPPPAATSSLFSAGGSSPTVTSSSPSQSGGSFGIAAVLTLICVLGSVVLGIVAAVFNSAAEWTDAWVHIRSLRLQSALQVAPWVVAFSTVTTVALVMATICFLGTRGRQRGS